MTRGRGKGEHRNLHFYLTFTGNRTICLQYVSRKYAVLFVLKILKNGCCYVFKFCGTCKGEIPKIFGIETLEKSNLEDLDTDGKITLKYFSNK
jgi:hypothetical protein